MRARLQQIYSKGIQTQTRVTSITEKDMGGGGGGGGGDSIGFGYNDWRA